VYDICSRESFDEMKSLLEKIKDVRENQGQVMLACVLGNKTDLDTKRVVTYEDGKKVADGLGCLFGECSAKTGENVERGFLDLVKMIKKQRDMEKAELEEKKIKEEEARRK